MASKSEGKEKEKKGEQGAGAQAAASEEVRAPKVHLLRGFKDILPSEQPYWDRVRSHAEALARAYGFARIDTPILEETALFTRAVGTVTDIVEKEMFSFTDRGGDAVSLRPEGTAGAMRAYVEHGMLNLPQPVKLSYLGPFFRYDRPQAGRLRQFHQWGLEIVGDLHPATDAELLVLGTNFFRELGIPVVVQVNSIGCHACRTPYIEELTTYLKTHRTQLSEESRERLVRAPLRVLDSKQEEDREIIEAAPQMVDWLCEECKQHFIRFLEYLDELEVPYALAPFLVRGLDYYTKTVYEFVPAASMEDDRPQPSQGTLAAGGRYDALIEQLGGRPTPATGMAFGLERIILKMKEAVAAGTVPAPEDLQPSIYLAQLGDQAKRKALRLFEGFRREGIAVAAHFSKDSLKQQLEHANRLGVKLTLILGQKEVIDETIIVREMSSGIQEIVAFDKVFVEVRKRLEQDAVRESVDETVKVAEGTVSNEAPQGRREGSRNIIEEEEEEGDALDAPEVDESEPVGEVVAGEGDDDV